MSLARARIKVACDMRAGDAPDIDIMGCMPCLAEDYLWSACTICWVTFFASPNSIIVFGRKNSSLSTPA